MLNGDTLTIHVHRAWKIPARYMRFDTSSCEVRSALTSVLRTSSIVGPSFPTRGRHPLRFVGIESLSALLS